MEKDLKSELSGNFEDVVLASLQEVPEMKASALRKAMKGAGTSERVLIQVLAVASNAEIQQIKQAYQTSNWIVYRALTSFNHKMA